MQARTHSQRVTCLGTYVSYPENDWLIRSANFHSRCGELTPARLLPEDPLTFITRCVRERRVYWTYHVALRMKKRSLSRQMILESVGSYEVIESYPEDKYLPSYLVFAMDSERVAT